MDKLELLLLGAAALCGQKRCWTCEFQGKEDRTSLRRCQVLLFAKYLREHGVEVKDDAAD